MKTAQRMVDEEAKNAGYTIKAFHGSKSEFTFFDESKRGSNTKTETSKRWFFAADKKTANSYYTRIGIGIFTRAKKAVKFTSKPLLRR